MQRRYLQTPNEIGMEQNSTIVFSMSIDIIEPFLDLVAHPVKAADAEPNSIGNVHVTLAQGPNGPKD